MLTFLSVHDQELVGVASTETKVVVTFTSSTPVPSTVGLSGLVGADRNIKTIISLHNCHYLMDMTVRMRTLLTI